MKKKTRFLHMHPETNAGKLVALDALQVEYTAYLAQCVAAMLAGRRFSVRLQEKRVFFSPCETFSSQIVKNVRAHAIGIVSGWAASKYATTLKPLIKKKFKTGDIDEAMCSALRILGKRLVDRPSGKVTQAALDMYWSWLLDTEIVGRPPTVSGRCGMRMCEMTSVLSTSKTTGLTIWWLGFSNLDVGRRIYVPLVPSPYIKTVEEASKGVLARKTRAGRWRFEVVDRKTWEVPEADPEAPVIGVDVGLNVIAATSSGLLLGGDVKPNFDRLYSTVKTLRANRQRQGLKENSPRLDCLESKLSGMVKTYTGEVANQLVSIYPCATFACEDLDLKGSKGQKRFAYRALHASLSTKAPIVIVNPAYTSQMCPSCSYVSRANRSGIKFHCRGCGRKGHADVVGGLNLLGRSEDKQIGLDDHPSVVKGILRERYRARRRDSSSGGLFSAPAPSGRRLTTGVPQGTGTASNLVDVHAQGLEQLLEYG